MILAVNRDITLEIFKRKYLTIDLSHTCYAVWLLNEMYGVDLVHLAQRQPPVKNDRRRSSFFFKEDPGGWRADNES